jgi:predicted HTH transcriptional regulator
LKKLGRNEVLQISKKDEIFFDKYRISDAPGRGIERIKEECQRFGKDEPVFKSKGCEVATTFQWDNKNFDIVNDIVNEENVIINDENVIINDEKDIVNEENVIINQKNGTIKSENGTIKSENGTINDIVNDIVNDTVNQNKTVENKKDISKKTILKIITENENISLNEIVSKSNISRRTTMRYLDILKKENKIEYYGAPKTGGYRIIKQKTS